MRSNRDSQQSESRSNSFNPESEISPELLNEDEYQASQQSNELEEQDQFKLENILIDPLSNSIKPFVDKVHFWFKREAFQERLSDFITEKLDVLREEDDPTHKIIAR